jgi:NAD(P)-dependent dehydrogenase (short-subunit alcohol dehydrogenase family)
VNIIKGASDVVNAPRLANNVAIITGGAQGIGRATAIRLAQEGAAVALWDLNKEKCNAVAQELVDAGFTAQGFEVDATNKNAVINALDSVMDAFQHVDILVNNVGGGGGPPAKLVDFDEKYWESSIDSNLKSAFICSKYFAKALKENSSTGKIVNIASVNGKSGTPLLGLYSIAKAGVIRLTEVMARELASNGVNVNCVCPGVVETDITKKILEKYPAVFVAAYNLAVSEGGSVREALERQIPLGRLAKPEEVADAVLFLASNEASYITGQSLNVCGGMMSA